MQVFEVPLSAAAQSLNVSAAGQLYGFSLNWNQPASAWMLHIDDESGTRILSSIPLVTGLDLLGQHKHLGFGFQLIVQSDGDPDFVPTYETLGVSGHLYVVIPDE